MFKRRDPLSRAERMREAIWPRIGLFRAAQYFNHRIKRLSDSPRKIALGLALGVFASFTPLFGFHFVLAVFLAWVVRANVLASMVGTLFGNPITFPLIASLSLWIGRTVFGFGTTTETLGNFEVVAVAFAKAFLGLWQTMKSLVTSTPAAWDLLADFFTELFLPYLLGGLIPGFVSAVVVYVVAAPLIEVWQARRAAKYKARIARRRERQARKATKTRTNEG